MTHSLENPKDSEQEISTYFFFIFQGASEGKVLISYHAWMKFYWNVPHKSYVFYLKWVKYKYTEKEYIHKYTEKDFIGQ